MANEPQRSWTNIGVGAAIAVSFVAAGWTIFQNEFGSIKDTATADRVEVAREIAEIKGNYLTTAEHRAYATGVADQLSGIRLRLVSLEIALASMQPRLAHDPVEDKTFQSVIVAIGKQIDQTQSQIADINRQIAAALIIIDSNAGIVRKTAPALPP